MRAFINPVNNTRYYVLKEEIVLESDIEEITDRDYYPLPMHSDERGTVYLNHSLDDLRNIVRNLPAGGERDAMNDLVNQLTA